MTNTETLRGEIDSIRFTAEDTGWTVAILNVHKDQSWKGKLSIVGIMPQLREGDEVEVAGELINDTKFGWQFKVTQYLPLLPTTIEGIKRHLGSGLYPDIGPETARKVVNHFGEDTIKILDEDPSLIEEVEGVGRKRKKSFIKHWSTLRQTREVSVMLATWGVTPGLAVKLMKHYGDKLIETLKMNPYVLADDVHGIGFKKADDIARGMGIEFNDQLRVNAAIKYALRQSERDGHCFLTTMQLIDNTWDLLYPGFREEGSDLSSIKINSLRVGDRLVAMINSKEIYTDEKYSTNKHDQACYIEHMLMMEQDVAVLVAMKLEEHWVDAQWNLKMTSAFDSYVNKNLVLDEKQESAVKMAANSPFSILTGGPGTGKTTTLNVIIKVFEREELEVLLAAPTGRAAKRMSEVTGHPARTIHRLLEYIPDTGFTRDENNQLEGDLLIIDESSMVDLPLFYHLMKAVPPKMQVLMVGDPDQLPSVGPGNVLRDLIKIRVPCVHLTEIFRQAAESMIVRNAHSINHGNPLILAPVLPDKEPDLFFFSHLDPKKTADSIVDAIANHFDPKVNKIADIQVLAPMKRGECGVHRLNERLQQVLNPHRHPSDDYKYGSTTFRVGDRVMHIKNNYTLGVFNGDVGVILEVRSGDDFPVVVEYDGIPVEYSREFIAQLVLAYAATIHKSQGSEYDYVVIAFPVGPPMFLVRNLLYTGITRAKKLCLIFGDPKAINMAIRNDTVKRRNTLLGNRIGKVWNKDKDVKINV